MAMLGTVVLLCSPCLARTGATPSAASSHKAALTQKELERLARSLKGPDGQRAYLQLSAIAIEKSSGTLGVRAALALGYFDYNKGRYAQAMKWFEHAKNDPLLSDYALYWTAETNLAQDRNADALSELKQFRTQFPDSVITDQALQSLGEAAMASNRPADAVAALDSAGVSSGKASLLLLRAEARERTGDLLGAASDYEAVYLRFPTSEQAREAGVKLSFLRGTLGDKFPHLSLSGRLEHASTLFAERDWPDARSEYSSLLAELSGAERERAALRILECGVALGAGPAELVSVQITSPEVDAERFAALADYYRSRHDDAQMTAAVEASVMRAPGSSSAESALFLAGNYYWVQLDRDRAASYYKRVEENFPTAADATAAQWRVGWTAVLKRQPDSSALLTEHLRRFPGSPYTADALYWLGRLAEEDNQLTLARSYYLKLTDRYRQNYFETLASERLRALGREPVQVLDVVAQIPPVAAVPKLDGETPPAAVGHHARAQALRSIAFDSSAELELRAGYDATGDPRLLLEVAQTAASAGRYGAAIVAVRQIFPQLESQPFFGVPREVWTTAYALPFESSIRRWSAHFGVDPLLIAGLVHQESAFDPEAHSVKDAVGLMQLLPGTARRLARDQKIRYSRLRLTDPDYNVRLGTAYFAALVKQFGSTEAALAAYNAGEDRVESWTTGQTYRDTAEFVDSIPFTETRQYVQIIARNSEIYHRLYGPQSDARGGRLNGGH
jgi:soluble lytic murein transglycosylase